MQQRRLSHWILIGLLGVVVLLRPDSARAASRLPTQLCLTWVSFSDVNDTADLNLIARPVPGKVSAHFPNQKPAVLKFFDLHGMASKGLGGPQFANLQGTGWMYANTEGVWLTLSTGRILLEGEIAMSSGEGGLVRTTADGVTTGGLIKSRPCSQVVIDD